MLAPPRPSRPSAWLVALAALSSAAGIAPAQQPAGAAPAVLKGRVTDKAGVALPGVRVRVVWPATDMRFVNPHASRPIGRLFMPAGDEFALLETQSGVDGEYRLEVPGITEATRASLDAMAPGYRSLAGMPMKMGDAKSVDLEPGKQVEADLALEPALYCRGVVVDEGGHPVAGVKVDALASSEQASGWVEVTVTGADGAFELFNYPIRPVQFQGGDPTKGRISFSHPDYVEALVEDIYALGRDARENLRVVLPTGRKLGGTVRDDSGRPVPNALVKAGLATIGFEKGTRTDAAGRFALRGLSAGEATLDVRALPIKQNVKLPLTLDADRLDLEVKLQPIAFPKDLKTYDMLGMKLADVTPELQAAYDLYHPQGAVILDPGPNVERLALGAIEEGNEFWMAGQQQVRGLRDFVDRIIAETGGRDAESYSVRVVYTFITPETQGTNTRYLKLTRDDLAQLKELAERLKAEAK